MLLIQAAKTKVQQNGRGDLLVAEGSDVAGSLGNASEGCHPCGLGACEVAHSLVRDWREHHAGRVSQVEHLQAGIEVAYLAGPVVRPLGDIQDLVSP